MPQYWMVVSSKYNFEATKHKNFTVQGVKSRHRRKAMAMQPGDKLMYYITGVQKFAGITEVTSTFFEGDEPIWVDKKGKDSYPWRVRIKPDLILEEKDWVDSAVFKDKLQHIQKWPEKHWKLAFQGNVHNLSRQDYNMI